MDSPANLRDTRILWAVLTVLLILRIPYTIAIIYLLPIENQIGGAVYETCTYVLLAFLIWFERGRLAGFHIDSISLGFILLFRPLQTLILTYWQVDSPLAFPNIGSLIIWITSITLTIILWRSGFKLSRLSTSALGWLAAGLLIGAGISIAQNIDAFHFSGGSRPLSFALLSTSLNLLYHLGFAPINEEPLFRGFLWGALRERKWNEGWVMTIQIILFTVAHVYYAARYPLRFWVFIPLAALVFGILATKSRSVAPSILAHAMINGSAYLLIINLISFLRF